MPANRVYALLVGINDYGPDVEALDGCLNDVDLFRDYLEHHVDPTALAVETLKNGEATRANVIGRFRSHLGRARSGDVAVFQFCGHGARWASNAAFREAFPDGRDEGLVCVDSRRPGGYDLADKELAVLIAEVAALGGHMAVLLDCCHSGSGTRGIGTMRGVKPRLTHEVTTERPLETYLDGHYARLRDAGQPPYVPAARHILLAACERGQLAQEAPGHGLFTSTLVDVLVKSGGEISYADLFVRCRAAVRSRVFDQDPQFEAFDRFDAGVGFLGRPTTRAARARYLAYCEEGVWTVECGAIHGLSIEPDVAVAFALFPETSPTTPAGTALAVQVGPQKSEIALDFESAESARYLAEITTLPVAPMPVAFVGDDAARAAVQEGLGQRGVHIVFVDGGGGAGYTLSARAGRLALTAVDRDQDIGFARVAGDDWARAAASLAPAVRQVLQWERCLRLQNPRTAMDRTAVEFVYVERLEGGGERMHEGTEAILTYTFAGGEWRRLLGRFRIRNRSGQPLPVVLAYFSEAYGILIVGRDTIASGDAWVTLWGDGPMDYFALPDGVEASVERFKLVVATEQVDDFMLAQNELTLGDEYGASRAPDVVPPVRKAYSNEWFTKDFRIRVVRQPPAR